MAEEPKITEWNPEYKTEEPLINNTSGGSDNRGFSIDTKTNRVRVGAGDYSYNVNEQGLYLGSEQFSSAPFSVSMAGAVIARNISLYSNTTNAITIDYGSNILLKEGGSIKFTSVTAPIACTATLVATGTGNIDNGTHSYKVTFGNYTGETSLGTASNEVTADATHKQVNLSAIPVSASGAVTKREIYRTKAGGIDYYLLTTILNNTETTYTDNIADADLTGEIANYKENDTFGKIIVNGVESLSLGANTFVGQWTGYEDTTGYNNTFIGYVAGEWNTTGYCNTFVGFGSGDENTTGSLNTFLGQLSGLNNVNGWYNTAVGADSLILNVDGGVNVAIGNGALYSNVSGGNNTAIGVSALDASIGSGNVALGYTAGAYETGSNAFYVNNQDRANTAGDKTLSLLYGVMAAAAANQKLTINGLLNQSVSKTPSAANDTGTAGDICWDANFIYVCVSTNTWKKVAIATW